MSLLPIPDFNDIKKMSELGKQYALLNRRNEALRLLRDAVTVINASDTREAKGIEMARQALDRLTELARIAEGTI